MTRLARSSTSSPQPSGWVQCRVDDAGSVQLGRQRSPGKRSDKYATKYVRAANITWHGLKLEDVLDMEFTPAERETFALHNGDVLLSEASGSADEVGKPAIWRGEIDLCCFQNTVIRFRPEATESRFAYYLFRHFAESGVFVKASLGVGIHHLGAQRFSALPMPLPPLQEQSRIADRLDELFTDLAAGVAALERVRAKLKRYRLAVLHAAVTGRLTAKWRAQNGPAKETGDQFLHRILIERRRQWEARALAKYEQDGCKPPKNWRERYVEPATPNSDDLPELPNGWCWVTVDQCADVQGGLQKSPARAPIRKHYPYLRVANVLRGHLDLSELHRFELTLEELEKLRLEIGDLLVVEGNGSVSEIGRSALWKGEVQDCVHQNHIIRCRFLQGIVPEYADTFVNSPLGQRYMREVASSTSGLHTLSVGKVRSIAFPLPPTIEQTAVVEAALEKLSRIEAMEAEVDRGLARARRLRQATLKAAFSGKLVPQDPKDEPATVLLERIKSERLKTAVERNGRPKKSAAKRQVHKAVATVAIKINKRKTSRSAKARRSSASRTKKRKSQ